MKIVYRLKINFLFVILALFSCESLEDTYKDYAGDGKIKYIGKCKSFSVTTGWKRFVFDWEKGADANIKNIEIHWRSDNGSGVITIPADQNHFETEPIFEDLPYSFECYGVGKDGDRSIPIMQYARPFTQTHELVLSFPRMVNKYFFLGNNKLGYDLVLFFDDFKEDVKSTILSYSQGGQQKKMTITKEMFDGEYYLIKNVDIDKDITVDRIAEVENCLDDVVFDTYKLAPDFMNLSLDVAQQIQDRHGLKEVSKDFVENLEVLELDRSLKSFVDVLYFPNLKKLVLGGNRFTTQPNTTGMLLSSVEDVDRSVFAITNVYKKLGIEVVIHNNQYGIQSKLEFATKKGNPILPTLEYLDTDDWTVTSSTKEGTGEDIANPENILDNNSATFWGPQSLGTIRTHELTIDMKSSKSINGFKITQAQDQKAIVRDYYPNIIRIQLSEDGVTWRTATYQFQSQLGLNYGESTIVYTPQKEEAQYVKLILTDKFFKLRANTCLGDFMIF